MRRNRKNGCWWRNTCNFAFFLKVAHALASGGGPCIRKAVAGEMEGVGSYWAQHRPNAEHATQPMRGGGGLPLPPPLHSCRKMLDATQIAGVCVWGGGVGTPGPAGSWKLRSAAIGTGAAGAPADALGPQAELRVVPCPSGLKSRSTREREAPPVDGAWAPRSHPPGGGGVRRAAACVIVWYSCTLTLTLPALGS